MTSAQVKVPKNRKLVRGVIWWILLPFRIFIEVLVTLFDMALSRYLIAGMVVGVVWTQLHLATDLSSKYWMWPTVVLGMCLTGLWDGCDIFTIRAILSRWLLIRHEGK